MLLVHGSILSRVGASGKPGAVQAAFQRRKRQIPLNDQRKFIAEEVAWIRERNKQCGLAGKDADPTDTLMAAKPCVMEAIRNRAAFLNRDGAPSTSMGGSTAQNVEDLLKGATESLRKGDPDRAIAELTRALTIDPQNVNACAQRGFVWSLKRDYTHAIADYDKGIEIQPNNPNLLLRHGMLALALRDADRAMADFNEAIKRNPKVGDFYIWRSMAWISKGDTMRAAADFQQAVDLAPNLNFQQNGLTTRAQYFKQAGLFEYMARDCEEALRQNPKNALARIFLYQAWQETPDINAGIEFFNGRVQQDPNDNLAYKGLALLYIKKGDLQTALRYSNEAIRTNPKAYDAFQVRGDIFNAMRRRNEAIASYRTALGLIDPRFANLRPPIEAVLKQLGASIPATPTAALSPVDASTYNQVPMNIECLSYRHFPRSNETLDTTRSPMPAIVAMFESDVTRDSVLITDAPRMLQVLKARMRSYCSSVLKAQGRLVEQGGVQVMNVLPSRYLIAVQGAVLGPVFGMFVPYVAISEEGNDKWAIDDAGYTDYVRKQLATRRAEAEAHQREARQVAQNVQELRAEVGQVTGQLNLANREDVEKAMRATAPSASCERQGTKSDCQQSMGGGYVRLIFDAADHSLAGILGFASPFNGAAVVRQQLDGLITLFQRFGFSRDEILSCLYFANDNMNVATKFVNHPKLRLGCSSEIRTDFVNGYANLFLKPVDTF